ncbi:hypothetical protein QCD85_06735 [Paenibacillus sp. PsM32]|uniref:IDEAL domain-containing protein n=1 Tax=Paenibacillus kyungheensis TaxID=1452732 RepID=A0AAX3LW96_9BACL|nr:MULTISPECIES: hypothetical protein [Paenibacillus]MDN4617787.1 hypothetical protein [Paenibacillus sp. PsM32]MDQ1234517.1 hypothetical protein [Paenibacillus sp. SORGH_AS_0306]MDR6111564.1 hypothetical protein [Paenibacillus sp. SORGH_AS_0338]WCT54117.1 hypothetical protein PQ456_12975 [Paenibacillus kyungheensis]WDF52750.1 hypothetical protein PQ460_10170 [Paenibacillus sp. KACC 21273]
MKSKMRIDPEKFAYTVISSYSSDKDNAEAVAKDHLGVFLNAYFLAEKFNTLEAQLAEKAESKDFKALLAKLMDTKLFG